MSKKNQKLIQEIFIKRVKMKHGDRFDLSQAKYIDSKTKVKVICNICGYENYVLPNNLLRGRKCPYCSHKIKFNTEVFIKFAIEKHGNFYDYSKTKYKNAKTPVVIICPIHGEFEQTPDCHLRGHGCPYCGGSIKLTYEIFVERSREVHGDRYGYEEFKYINLSTKGKIFCKKCGEYFWQTPGHHIFSKRGCPHCQKSLGEIETEKYLLEHNYVFEKQKRFNGFKLYSFDFYLPELNICIEYDGIQHFQPVEKFGGEEEFKKIKKRDKTKNKFCSENNIKLIRIRYDQKVEDTLNEELKHYTS